MRYVAYIETEVRDANGEFLNISASSNESMAAAVAALKPEIERVAMRLKSDAQRVFNAAVTLGGVDA